MKHLSNLLLTLAVALAAVVVTGCSHTQDILETIPSDAMVVVKIDAKTLIDKAELIEKKNTYALPTEISDKIKNEKWIDEALEEIYKVSECVDMSNLFVVVLPKDDGNAAYQTLRITDYDKFIKIIKDDEFDKGSRQGGYESYEKNVEEEYWGQYWLFNDDHTQAWHVEGGKKGVEKVTEALKRANSHPYTDNEGPAKILAKDCPIAMACTAPQFNKKWITTYAELPSDGKATAKLQLMDQDGTLCAFDKYFQPINPELLEYMPQDADLIAGFAINEKYDFADIDKILKKFLSSREYAQFDQIRNTFKPTGDILFGIKIPKSDDYIFDFDRHPELIYTGNWTMIAQIKDPDAALTALHSLMVMGASGNNNLTVGSLNKNKFSVTFSESMYHYDYSQNRQVYDGPFSMSFEVGIINKCLYASSVAVKKNSVSDEVSNVFNDAYLGYYVKPNSKIASAFGLTDGLTASIRWEGAHTFVIESQFPDSDHSYVYDMINMCANVENKMREYWEKNDY